MRSLKFLLRQNLSRLLFKISPILKFTIQEESMLPVLKPGDVVLVNRLSRPRVGDLVVLKNPENERSSPTDKKMFLVKRIHKVYDRTLYVLGDNTAKSIDSRHFGLVKRKDIIGRVIYVYG